MEKKITKKSLVVDFLATQTDKKEAWLSYELMSGEKVTKATFGQIWNEVKGSPVKEVKVKTSHDDIINIVHQMYKEQEEIYKPFLKSKIELLLTEDIEKKKEIRLSIEKVMDAYQKKNVEIRNYMEANPFS